ELRPHGIPVELLPGRPAALAAGDPPVADVAGVEQLRQPLLELGASPSREARAVADEVEPVAVVEAEEERRDPPVGLVAPAEADDRAVGRLVLLDLDDAVARAGQIGETEPLRDHAVEAGD